MYVEDLKRGSNAGVGPKDLFEIASNTVGVYIEWDGFLQTQLLISLNNIVITSAFQHWQGERQL